MTIHLKLFSFTSLERAKVPAAVACPFELDVKQWCTDDCEESDRLYQLVGIVVHEGSSASSGHYFSYISSRLVNRDDQSERYWYCFDDSDVTSLSDQDLDRSMFSQIQSTKTSYLLFYQRD
mmetsp:Transcript_13141/g.34917  ORF Transcript_13141/g.34917 Transcript_13141/m.34917 type:complete len:121 (+) Transcript_13141:184-546(+)